MKLITMQWWRLWKHWHNDDDVDNGDDAGYNDDYDSNDNAVDLALTMTTIINNDNHKWNSACVDDSDDDDGVYDDVLLLMTLPIVTALFMKTYKYRHVHCTLLRSLSW